MTCDSFGTRDTGEMRFCNGICEKKTLEQCCDLAVEVVSVHGENLEDITDSLVEARAGRFTEQFQSHFEQEKAI